MKSKMKLDKMIATLHDGLTPDHLDIAVTTKIYDDIKHLLVDGKYKGFRIIC